MSKQITKKIISCELVKIEKSFNKLKPGKFFYNLELEGIEELLLLETEHKIIDNLVGRKIKYKLNSENEVSEFDLI